MSRFFVNKNSVDPGKGAITITGEDVKHIGSVLRAAPGDTLELSDGLGTDYEVVIEQLTKDAIFTRITGSRPNTTEPPIDVTLFQGIPKADKMDFIIQKCIELGVSRIVPVITARTVVKFANKKDADSKATRWRRIALEAAKQCDRGIVPEVGDPVGFEEALKLAAGYDLKLLPYEEESRGSLRRQLQDFSAAGMGMPGENTFSGAGLAEVNSGLLTELPEEHTGLRTGLSGEHAEGKSNRKSIAVFIGPEGGFSPAEAERAVQAGLASVTLGPRILRTETAGLAVASIIMYELGDMGSDRQG